MNAFFNTHANEIFALINSAFVLVILPMVGAWLKNHLGTQRGAKVEKAMQSGLQAAIASVSEGKKSSETISSVLNDPTVRAAVVALAVEYVQKTVPATVSKLGIDEALPDIASARVESAVAKLAENYTTANTAIAIASQTEYKTGAAGMPNAVAASV